MKRCAYLPDIVVVILLLFAIPAAWSQTSGTSVRGTVTDSSGAVVAGAQITLDNAASGFHVSKASDTRGLYAFPQLPPGTYTISVKAEGFAAQNKQATLLVNQPATINFSLSVSGTTTTVDVSAEAETLNVTDATIGNAVGNNTIQALPMEGRNVPDLLSLQPGTVYLGREINQDLDSRSGAVSGARSDQSNVSLDGVDNNDQRNGYAFTGVLRSTLDSVEEFRVTTTNSNADSGRNSGAQVVMVTKSGTNNFHGGLYEYNRNTATSANNWFNKQAELSQNLPNVPGKLIRNTYGGSVGGPIKKDKLFFFFNYEGQKTSENQQETLQVPTASMRAGFMKYPTATGQIVNLSPVDLAKMDPNCTAAGTCPWGPGVDPNALKVLNSYPLPNGFVSGDGLNTASFTWSAPNPTTLNTYITKLDYAVSSTNHVFVRGNLQGDTITGVPQFPANPPGTVVSNNSKGVAAGDTWTLRNNLINNLRYGYIREGVGTRGAGNASYVNFGTLSSPVAQNRTVLLNVPVHNLVDDFTWVRGNHTLQFGGNYRLVHNNTVSNATAFNTAYMIPGLLNPASIANQSVPGQTVSLDPLGFGFPAVDNGFANSYDNDVMAVAGVISWVFDNSNYKLAQSGNTASLLPTGSMIPRNFKANEFEWYVQDSWRVKPNLTVTLGVRHTLLQTPYEVSGQQVAPNIDIHQWFQTRGYQAVLGNSVQPPFSFVPTGQARGGKPYWPMNKGNFAPRLAIAYSPKAENGFWRSLFGGPGKTSIRAGAGMYYDHFGEGVVDSFSQLGSFGMTTALSSPQNIWTTGNAPRYTGLTAVPNVARPAPVTLNYPATPSTDVFGSGFAIAYGLDDQLKTPYSVAADFSIQRELRGGFVLEAAYVGRFGHHLLQQLDLAAPLDLVDPKSGMDYFTASRLLSAAVDQGATTLAPIPYWENMFPAAATPGVSATKNIYTNLFTLERGNEVANPYFLDVICVYPAAPGAPCGNKTGRFWPLQYSSLYSWVTDGTSSYNAGQLMLRHQMSHGLQMDFSYTFGKSIDLGSDAERMTSGGGVGNDTVFSEILDSWNPGKNRGPSDFDTRHVITADWVYELPVGRGKTFAGRASGWLDALIGGWQISGLNRWTSGLPFSVQSGLGWTTNWNFRSNMVQTAPIQTGLYFTSSGAPEVFKDPNALVNATGGTPWRVPYAGDAGSRNNFRGQGYFGIDSGLAKTWSIHEKQNVRFAWEVFNVTNSVRFDVNTNTSLQNISTSGSLGVYGAVLTAPRVQQFSLRYSF
ncbi:MAG TPA: carboxypeptidase-like regulatory domain-containing protein [Terriglobales bacterium]